MRWLRAVVTEIWSLFVDDGSFAVAIVLWLAIVLFWLRRFGWASRWGGIALFAGLALILIESVVRQTRKRR